MTREDAIRWDERYRLSMNREDWSPRPLLLQHQYLFENPGLALDIAMGLGANAGFLLNLGWRVIGLDISAIALRAAKSRFPVLQAAVYDLQVLQLPSDHFDLIMNFYYLDRNLWSVFRRTLRPGGLLVIETLRRDMTQIKNELNPAYLLEPGELLQSFHDWQVIYSHEGWLPSDHGGEKSIASLIARRP